MYILEILLKFVSMMFWYLIVSLALIINFIDFEGKTIQVYIIIYLTVVLSIHLYDDFQEEFKSF